MDVLDDFQAEAEEIFEHNPWLTYALPLHRLREFGYKNKEIDLLDEMPLATGQFNTITATLANKKRDDIPSIQVDYDEWKNWYNEAFEETPTVFNPITKKKEKWIVKNNAKKQYGPQGACCTIM